MNVVTGVGRTTVQNMAASYLLSKTANHENIETRTMGDRIF
jgi:hypothetical protein